MLSALKQIREMGYASPMARATDTVLACIRVAEEAIAAAEQTQEVALSAAFLDALIKRSTEAELCLMDSGRLRFQRAMAAAIKLYLEQNVRPADKEEEHESQPETNETEDHRDGR